MRARDSSHTVDIDVLHLIPRPVRRDEFPELRAMWWRLAAQGHRMPAEIDVIVITGGQP